MPSRSVGDKVTLLFLLTDSNTTGPSRVLHPETLEVLEYAASLTSHKCL